MPTDLKVLLVHILPNLSFHTLWKMAPSYKVKNAWNTLVHIPSAMCDISETIQKSVQTPERHINHSKKFTSGLSDRRGSLATLLWLSSNMLSFLCIPVAVIWLPDGRKKCGGQQGALSVALRDHSSTTGTCHHLDIGADCRLDFPSRLSLSLLRQDIEPSTKLWLSQNLQGSTTWADMSI